MRSIIHKTKKALVMCLAAVVWPGGCLWASAPPESEGAPEEVPEEVAIRQQPETPLLPGKEPNTGRRVFGLLPPLRERIDRQIKNYLFVPKKAWAAGVQVSYMQEDLKNYEFYILEGWDASANLWSVSPFFCYFFKDNMGAGARFSHQNNMIRIDKLDFSFGEDLDLDIRNLQLKEQSYVGSAFLRMFVGLGANKRFGLVNDVVLSYAWGKGNLYSGRNEPVRDTHHKYREFTLGLKPGLAVFITNEVSVEATVNMLGFRYRETKQFENGERVGTRRFAKGNFKADLLSLNIGLTIYL